MALFVASASGATSAEALDPAKRTTQYVFDNWGTANGLPVAGVQAIAQTPDGYLWLGTEGGLVRFDGASFRTFNLHDHGIADIFALLVDERGALWLGTNAGLARWTGSVIDATAFYSRANGLRENRVEVVHQDRNGALWIGTSAGLHRLKDGKLTVLTVRDGLPHDHIQALADGHGGALWIGTNGGLACLRDGVVTTSTVTQGLPHKSVLALREDRSGVLWVGTFSGLARLDRGTLSTVPLPANLSRTPVNNIETDADGSLWASTYGGGILRWRDGRVERFAVGDGLTDDLVLDLCLDRDGSLWIATDRLGLGRLKDGVFTAWTAREGLPNDTIRSVTEDREGSIWIGTHGGGLASLRDGRVSTITRRDHLLSDLVFSLAAGRNGSLWIGTYNGGLNRIDAGRVLTVASDQFKKNQFITAIHEDVGGSVWFGTYGGGLKRFTNGTFSTFAAKDGLGSDYVWSLADAGAGGLWIGTRAGVTRWAGGAFTRFAPEDGWPDQAVWALFVDTDGTLWVGTDGGLYRVANGRPFRITSKAGLHEDTIFAILEDDQQRLWMSSNRGIFRTSKHDIEELAAGRRSAITSDVYGVADGMKTAECNGSTQPAAWRAHDGRLWFATAKGVVVVDPRATGRVPRDVPVFIEDALVDTRPLPHGADAGERPTAEAGSRQFEFRYSAPSLRAPERLRFRYRLEPLETEWLDAGTRRVAYYTNLPPGQLRFRVMASEDGASWNEATAASFAFGVRPYFYQTWWFYGLCTGAAGAVLLAGHRYRLRQVVALERVRARIAGDLHDDLGSSLSQIAILSEVARSRASGDAGMAEPLDRIAALSRDSIDAMADIVWAIDPQRDTSVHLTQRMRRLASELLPLHNIDLQFDVADDAGTRLGAEVRRQVYLTFKEMLHNVVRHSRATRVRVQADIDAHRLRLTVADDGCGFAADIAGHASGGQGLRSMQERASRLGGAVEVESTADHGTRVTLTLPLD